MCVYNLFIFSQALIFTEYVKKLWEKMYFNCMLPLSPLLHVLCLFAQQDLILPCWCATGSYSPAGALQGLLSLLMLYKYPTLKFHHGNKIKWPLVIEHINWVDNHQMIITTNYGSHGSFLLPWQPIQEAVHQNFSYF